MLDASMDCDVIHFDAALEQQFFNVSLISFPNRRQSNAGATRSHPAISCESVSEVAKSSARKWPKRAISQLT